MRIEPKAAFYNEETGAVQPWKDIEVTDSVGNALVSEGLAIAIAEGGGGGTGTKWNVVLNCPALEGYDMYLTPSAGDNDTLLAIPVVSGTYYSYYTIDLTSGATDLTFSYAVFDDSAFADVNMTEPSGSYTCSVTGDIVFDDSDGWNFSITGDGTITITED